MNVYFDNRGGTHSYVTLFCDDELYGRIAVDRDTINLIEIPDDVKVLKVSSVAIIYEFEELDKRIVENIDLCWEKEKVEKFGFSDRKWQYPYDALLLLNGCNGDIFIYQCTFPQEELSDALGYRARVLNNGQQIETKYVKRKERFYARETRLLFLLGASVALCLSCFGVLYCWHLISNNVAERHHGVNFYGSIVGMFVLPACVVEIGKYNGFLKESKLKSEYYLDSDGNWSSSEK